jgi:mannosyl-oligosaccharide alpha-1,2-mannosidase
VMVQKSSLDLLGTDFDIEKGAFIGTGDVAPDEPVDSFYEYLWGGWAMLGLTKTRDWYRTLTNAILARKSVRVDGRLWFALVDYQTGAKQNDATVSELASFYAELLAKGGDRAEGEAYFDSWTAVAQKYGLIPELIDYRTFGTTDPKYWMRPEYANSAFDLWFLTHDQKYRRAAYRHFEALRANCRVPNGYTVLLDVQTKPMTQGDYFPAYAFSENFKYLYLMFAESPRFDGGNYYLNTEGKIMRGIVR